MRPDPSARLATSLHSSWAASGTAPPKMPQWRSRGAVRTSISSDSKPRSEYVSAGRLGPAWSCPTPPRRRPQTPSMCTQQRGKLGAADLLFALEQADDVAGQRAARREPRLDRLNVGHQLALVIAGAASDDGAVADRAGVEAASSSARSDRRLDVVMAVDEYRRAPGGAAPVGDHGWIAAGHDDLGRAQAQRSQMGRQPGGAPSRRLPVVAHRRCRRTGRGRRRCARGRLGPSRAQPPGSGGSSCRGLVRAQLM